MKRAVQAKIRKRLAACALAVYLVLPLPSPAVTKMKLRGYITARVDDRTLAILDDKLEMTAACVIKGHDGSGEHFLTMAEPSPCMLIEADVSLLDTHNLLP